MIEKAWTKHLKAVNQGRATLDMLPRARLHMMFERKANVIKLHDLEDFASRLPQWDEALLQASQRKGLT
jgi:hypothetical protein